MDMETKENFLTGELRNFKENYSKVFSDFLLCFISALVACVVGILIIKAEYNSPDKELLTKLLFVSSLGIPLFFALTLFNKAQKFSRQIAFALQGLGIGLLVLYFFTIETESYFDIIQYSIYSLAFHLFAAFAPIKKLKDNLAFWQYNLKLLQTFIITNLFSGILTLGIILALQGIKTLLNVDIDEKVFGYSSTIIFTLFNTFRFLSLVDTNFENYSQEYRPKLIQILTSYALIPLSAIYTVILYAYMIKKYSVTDENELELGFGIFFAYSVLALLIVLFSYNRRSEVKWIDLYSKYLPYIMLPLLAINVHKINVYIDNHFQNISIYFLLVYCTWLFLLVMYNFINKFKNIKIIPITLSIICFLISIGPWSFTNVSIKSAQKRITRTLENYKVFENLAKNEITFIEQKDFGKLNKAIWAINDVKKGKYLIEIFDNFSKKYDLKKYDSSKVSIFNDLEFKLKIEVKENETNNRNRIRIVFNAEDKVHNIDNYQYFKEFFFSDKSDTNLRNYIDTIYVANNSVKLYQSRNGEMLNVEYVNHISQINLKNYYIKLSALIKGQKREFSYNLSYLDDTTTSFLYEDNKLEIKFIPNDFEVLVENNVIYKELDRFSCYILIKIK